jgi:hypothetical protein
LSGRCSHQLLYWYPSEKDAHDALAQVVVVSHWAAKQGIETPPELLGPWDLYLEESGQATSESNEQLPESNCWPFDLEGNASHCVPSGRPVSELESSSFESDFLHDMPPSSPPSERGSSTSPPAKRRRSASPNEEPEQQQCYFRIPKTDQACFLRPGETICSRVCCTLGDKCRDLHIQQPNHGSVDTLTLVDIEEPFFWNAPFLNRLRPVNEKDGNDIWHHTIAFVNLMTGVFILPQGGNGQCSDCGVWWYTTKRDAYEAIAVTVGRLWALNKRGFE